MELISNKKSGQVSIKKALNKTFRKQRPTRLEIEQLRLGLSTMLDEINPTESEEYHKGLLKDFLKNTAYKEFFINTNDRKDLVIHLGENSKSEVGVIIETKGPNNKTEMPTTDNLNKKATHELLLYFLRERITKKNFNVKHLIATNLREWFIFDSHQFDKFAEDSILLKRFKDFEEGRLSFEKTEHFYKEIAFPAIEEVKEKIKFVYFDIFDYKKHLLNQTKVGDINLIELQKILSPIHLLKIEFENDSNTLNKNFYNELLHIIGLEEYKEKGKKLIRRKLKNNCHEDSLIEAAITQIKSLYKLSQIKDIERFGGTTEDRLYNVALELALVWVNRILFLKLLESQIVSYHNNSKDYLFLNQEKISEYDDLNTLFFQVLAVPTKERTDRIVKKFPNIPYLNSSLFEPTELEQQTIFISNLPNNTTLPLYEKTILKNGNKKINVLEYIFKFLDSYDFSSESKEDIAEENRNLINASVLGLIFEKINGYKDGSFFTPGFITMYMCRQIIRRAVVKKFHEFTDFDSDNFIDLINFTKTYKQSDLKKYNEIINSLKICDPAVGSGHFLVSALNEIIAIKSELGILIDDNGKSLDYQIDAENDELTILDNRGEFFKYDPFNKESCRIQKTIFHEKQRIIENSLFGVDINANSVNICRLRLWIELLKNAYYKDDGELETLPNIDINIKTGNSIISRYPLDVDLKAVFKQKQLSIEAYRKAVDKYRSAKSKEQKHEMEQLIKKIKGAFTEWIYEHHPKRKKLSKLRGEMIELVDQYKLFQMESNKSKQKKIEKLNLAIKNAEAEVDELRNGEVYRTAFEWRFEFPEVLDVINGDYKGFDIVIGNPPYGLFNKKQNQKIALSIEDAALEIIKRDFPLAASGGINASRIFYNLALNLSCKMGFQSMIIPFGILTDTSSAILRKSIFYNHSYLNIDAFPERDNIKNRIFEDVKMSTAILLTCKSQISKQFNFGISYKRKIEKDNRFDLLYDDIIRMNPDLCQIPITTPEQYKVLTKIFSKNDLIKLGNISTCLTGEADMTFAKKAMTKDKNDSVLIKGVQVDRYEVKYDPNTISQGEIEYINEDLFKKICSEKKLKDAYKRRIILQGLTGINEKFRLKATLIEPPVFLANSCNYLLDKNKTSFRILLGLLNSRLINFVFKTTSTSSNVNGYEVDALPVPENIDKKLGNEIEKLVEKILTNKGKKETIEFESQIDQIVYNIYNLTDNDIEIIEAIQ